MTKNKQNPLLASIEAKLEAEFIGRMARHTEISLIAMLIAGNDLGFLGEKRADLLLAKHVEVQMQMAEELLGDAAADKELTYTKAILARRLKQILGQDGWNRCKGMFPLLQEYWDWEG